MSAWTRRAKTWISSAHQGYVEGNLCPNTIAAYRLAAARGADMIEIDARATRDGVQIVHHDPVIHGYDAAGNPMDVVISEADHATIAALHLRPEGGADDGIPTLDEALHIAYMTGMCINIDLKEGLLHAEEISRMVIAAGMRGRTVYATNGAGAEAIRRILRIDPEARFIDTKKNFTREKLADIPDYPARCYVYTGDFSDENIAAIRESGCMLATISLSATNAAAAFRHHPDMAEYPHTSDFAAIDKQIMDTML